MQLVLIGVKDLDAVLRAFGKRRAMPGIFVRAVGARRRLAGPARHFELGLARPQARIDQPVFDVLHLRSPMWLHGRPGKSARPQRVPCSSAPVGQNATKARRIRLLTLLEPPVPQRHITEAAWNRSGGALGRRKGPAKSLK